MSQSTPRVKGKLVIMGSGETAPTMVKVHRELLDGITRSIKAEIRASILDTPFGFQENADEITAKALEYFTTSVSKKFEVASLRRASIATSVQIEAFRSQLLASDYLFAGPGSPSYALRNWSGIGIGKILKESISNGATVVFSSAAALTLGSFTLPVYEVYKVGEDPYWLDGLGVVNLVLDKKVAVIPHYNNKEGANHDTRFCYMGKNRLDTLEASLPPDSYVLGVDEHSGIIFDLETQLAKIVGIGTVTIRHAGGETIFPSGSEISIDELFAPHLGKVTLAFQENVEQVLKGPELTSADANIDPLGSAIDDLTKRFDEALLNKDAEGVAEVALDTEAEIHAWSSDTLQSDSLDRARDLLRRIIHSLSEAASVGMVPRSQVIDPYVQILTRLRSTLRDEKNYHLADLVRNQLSSLGVELRDEPEGTSWFGIDQSSIGR